jgi:hypothetical protein
MEKLILRCGRYVSPAVGDTETRVRLMEAYLAELSRELEYLLGELDGAVAVASAVPTGHDADGGEGGSV